MKDLVPGLEFQVSERFARAVKKGKMMQRIHFWKYNLDFGHQGGEMGDLGHLLNWHFGAQASREWSRQTCQSHGLTYCFEVWHYHITYRSK